MRSGNPPTPPFNVLAAALRDTTERLAQELASPSQSAPAWSELEWAIARAAAAIQGITMLLAHRLRWRGPASWESFLAEQRRQGELRDARIGRLLARLDAAAREAGIACVALKGSALRSLGLYRPGERPMADVDLLAHPADLDALATIARRLDYVQTASIRRHAIFAPRAKSTTVGLGEHADNPIKIEIHTAVAERLPVDEVAITALLRPLRPEPGLSAYPSAAALAAHLLLHAAGSMIMHTLRQIQLHDVAGLARRLGPTDWAELFSFGGGAHERPWWAYPPLALAERYYPGSVPGDILRELRRSCPVALGFAADRWTLTDVSLSNLRIHALPGLPWSRSPLDALRYARSRVLPPRADLAQLRLLLDIEPQLNRVRWYGASHAERIVRWVFSRPPRVQTLATVTAALDSYRPSGPA